LLYRRLWLVLLCYVLVTAGFSVIFHFMNISATAQGAVGLLIGLVFGFEASTMRRWTYQRRGWSNIGVVVGDDEEEAERRFFAEWVARDPHQPIVRDKSPSPPVPRNAPVTRSAPASTDIVGLFPQPERRS